MEQTPEFYPPAFTSLQHRCSLGPLDSGTQDMYAAVEAPSDTPHPPATRWCPAWPDRRCWVFEPHVSDIEEYIDNLRKQKWRPWEKFEALKTNLWTPYFLLCLSKMSVFFKLISRFRVGAKASFM